MPSHICAREDTHTHTERESDRESDREKGIMRRKYLRASLRDKKYHINETGASSLYSSFSICQTTFFAAFYGLFFSPPPPHLLVAMHVACTPAPFMLPLSLVCSLSLTHLDSLVIFHSSVSQGPPALPSTSSSTPSHHLSSCKTLCCWAIWSSFPRLVIVYKGNADIRCGEQVSGCWKLSLLPHHILCLLSLALKEHTISLHLIQNLRRRHEKMCVYVIFLAKIAQIYISKGSLEL